MSEPKRDRPTKEEIVAAAEVLGVEPAALAAVAEVESGPQGAFDKMGRPTILYERHVFHRLTQGRFDGRTATVNGRTYQLSSPGPGDYGPFIHQWPKVSAATKLDLQAALKSTSWGLFQILGEGFADAGAPNIESFVASVSASVWQQLNGFCNWIIANRMAHGGLKARNWKQFAAAYNGPGYAKNDYDRKMAAAYDRLRPSYTTTEKEA